MLFRCIQCEQLVGEMRYGGYHRNHCPWCLWSQHVDEKKGDRASSCRGRMKPIGKFQKRTGEEVIVHQCEQCGVIRWNRVAGDDDVLLTGSLIRIDVQ